MKPLYWDMTNPFTGTPFTWDDPNLFFNDEGIGMYLEPGDPGFTPYPGQIPGPEPKPKKKPFRRKPKPKDSSNAPTTPANQPSTNMNTFQYNIAPNPNGGFTTRPVLGEAITEAALIAQVAAATGLTAEQVTAAVGTFLDKLLVAAATGGFSQGLLGRLRFRPTSGGSQPTPSGFNNPDELNASVALSFTADTIANWRSSLTIESMGEVGKVSPLIDSICSQENGQQDHYVAGTMVEISGSNLRFQKTDTTQGVFLRTGNNAEVRCTVYGTVTPTSLSVLIPAGTTGPQTVRVAAYINGSVRSFTYMDPITL